MEPTAAQVLDQSKQAGWTRECVKAKRDEAVYLFTREGEAMLVAFDRGLSTVRQVERVNA